MPAFMPREGTPLPLLADQVLGRHAHVVEEHWWSVHHRPDRPNGETVAERLAHVDEEDREPVGALGDGLARVVRASRSIRSECSARLVQIF